MDPIERLVTIARRGKGREWWSEYLVSNAGDVDEKEAVLQEYRHRDSLSYQASVV